MGTMQDCLLLLATLVTLAPPVFALTTDRILGFPARVVLIISLPALVLSHFSIGATCGITYTLLFGRGTWPLAFGWGAFVWLVMMVMMPVMMPMIDFPWWFVIVPLLAHMAMAAPIGWVPRRFVNEEADGKSFLGLLRAERQSVRLQGT